MSGRAAVALFALVCLLILGTLDVRPLYKADESRYAEIPREMVADGNWITPRLNGFKYFEKPPLQYWATAAFFSVFGEKDWVARLWTALTGLAGIALVFLSGKKLFGPQAGTLGALVLAGCPLYVLLMQVNTLDMALTFFLSAAIFAFSLGRYYVFWAACALAVLSKGLIGIVLPGGAIGLYILVTGQWSLLKRMKIASGGLLFLALAAPWFVAVSAANPEFAHFFFIQEHFQRFTTKMHGRYQPIWYFLPIVAFGIAPWLLPFFASFRTLWGQKKASPSAFNPTLFLALWIGVVFVFFSISDSKLPSYVLPVFPALALLIGRALAVSPPPKLLSAQAWLAAACGVALAAAAPAVLSRFPAEMAAYGRVLAAAGLLLAAGATSAALAARRGRQAAAIGLLSLASFACTLGAMLGHRSIASDFTIGPQAGSLDIPAGTPIFAVDAYDHTLPWYFRRTVTMVSYKDELGQPIGWEPGKFIADLPAFAQAWKAAPAAYAVFSTEKYPDMERQLSLPMEVLSRGPRYTVVRKP